MSKHRVLNGDEGGSPKSSYIAPDSDQTELYASTWQFLQPYRIGPSKGIKKLHLFLKVFISGRLLLPLPCIGWVKHGRTGGCSA